MDVMKIHCVSFIEVDFSLQFLINEYCYLCLFLIGVFLILEAVEVYAYLCAVHFRELRFLILKLIF